MSRQQSPINPWSAEKIKATMNLPPSQSQEAGETVELLRQRVLRDAEQRFADGVRQLLGGGNPPSDASFKTAAETGGATQGDGKQQVPETGGPRQPSGTGTQVASSSTMTTSGGVPVPGGNLDPDLEYVSLGHISPWNSAWTRWMGCYRATAQWWWRWRKLWTWPGWWCPYMYGGSEPLIADVSVSAEEWWAVTLKGVDELYTQWLASDPLQRLRLDTGTSSAATRWPRTERRMTSLLLQAVPDNIKAEAVAARKLSVTHLLFTLFVKFQPGGQGERVTLIRFLTELKTTGSMVELAQNLRQWRRWWNRAQELAVMLPDPVILAGVLTRASDAIAKSGAQVAYRLSVCRQQLQIDTRPNLDSIKTFAELLQAETEEQALGAGGIGGAGNTTVPFVKAAALGASSTTATSATGNAQESKAAGVEFKGDCRFWLSDKGCRRGDRCKFKHGALSPKENRCFFCSGLNHTRRGSGRRRMSRWPRCRGGIHSLPHRKGIHPK